MKFFLLGSLLASSLVLANNSVQVNINNDTLELGADLYLNENYDLNSNSNYYFTMKYLRNEENNKESKSLSSIGFKVTNAYLNNNGFSFGLGIKSIYTGQMDKSFVALPLTIYGKMEINELIYIDANVGYSPRVLSFSDAETYSEIKLRANYKILEDGYIYVGARRINTEYQDIDESKFDSSVFFGFEVRF